MNSLCRSDNICVIAATNRPEDLDPACLRRFDVWVEVPLPSEEERYHLLRHLLSDVEHVLSDGEIRSLAARTAQSSRSDIAHIIREVAMRPIRELKITPDVLNDCSGLPALRPITYSDFCSSNHWAGEKDAIPPGGGGALPSFGNTTAHITY